MTAPVLHGYAKSTAGVYVAETEADKVGIGVVPVRSGNGIIYVKPELRRSGIGTGLLDAINNALELAEEPLIHPDRVFGHVVPYESKLALSGGW